MHRLPGFSYSCPSHRLSNLGRLNRRLFRSLRLFSDNLNTFFNAQKNQFIETVVLSTLNICFWFTNKKMIPIWSHVTHKKNNWHVCVKLNLGFMDYYILLHISIQDVSAVQNKVSFKDELCSLCFEVRKTAKIRNRYN